MAFLINLFSGMMPRMSPRLVDSKTPQKAVNVMFTSGELGVMKDNLQIGSNLLSKAGIKKTIYRFDQNSANESLYWFHWLTDVNVVRGSIDNDTSERTYFTGDVEPRMTYSPLAVTGAGAYYPLAQYKLGIPTPESTLSLTVSSPVISSITHAGTVATANTDVAHGRATGDSIVIDGATDVLYNGTFTITVIDADTFTYVMTAEPAADASGTITYHLGGLRESRVYGITYVSELGEEGPPLVSQLISAYAGQTVAITGIPVAPTGNYNILKKRLYRTASGSTQTTLRYVADITLAATTYNDSALTVTLGENIPTLNYTAPPSNMLGLIAIANGGMAAISDDQVMFCEPYQPHAWPTAYKYSFNIKPIALGAFGNSVVVLTGGKPSLLTGSDPSSMSQDVIQFGQPCMCAQSVVELAGGVMWASDEGLAFMSSQGFELATAAIFTNREWNLYKPSSIRGYRWRNRYVGFYDTGTVQGGFVFDKATGEFWELDFYATAGYTEPKSGDLYLAIGNNVLKLDSAGTNRTLTWKSKVFVEPRPVNMSVAKVVASAYPVTFKLYANKVLKHTQTVESELPFRLPSDYLETDYEVELSGTALISSVTVAESMDALKGIAE
jgi:hypothetical protein